MIYFLHGEPFTTIFRKSTDNHGGIDVRAIKRRGEVKIKNQFGKYESLYKVPKVNNKPEIEEWRK